MMHTVMSFTLNCNIFCAGTVRGLKFLRAIKYSNTIGYISAQSYYRIIREG